MHSFGRHPALRRAALVVAAGGTTARGAAYVGGADTGALTTFVDKLIPLHTWAYIWIAVAVLILAGMGSRTLSRWAMSLGAALWTVWGISFMWSTLAGESARGWVTGSLMLAFAGFMWIMAALIEDVPTGRDKVHVVYESKGRS